MSVRLLSSSFSRMARRTYAAGLQTELEKAGLRTVSYDAAETLSRRMRPGVPVMAIMGAREQENATVTLRERGGTQSTPPLQHAVALLAGRARV